MKVLVVIAVLSATVAVGFTQSNTGTCTNDQQMAFVTQQLGLVCGFNFAKIDPADSVGQLLPNISARSEPLNQLCTAECGGALGQFLSTCCEDEIGAAGLLTWCTPTGSVNPGEDRCYFTLPPVFNTSNFDGLNACDDANETNPCPAGCNQALTGVAMSLSCCFQSFYNNSEFMGKLQAVGAITPQEYEDLMALGNPLLWEACQVTIPDVCTGNPFPDTSTAAPINIQSTCPVTTMATTEGAVTFAPLVSLMVLLLATVVLVSY